VLLAAQSPAGMFRIMALVFIGRQQVPRQVLLLRLELPSVAAS